MPNGGDPDPEHELGYSVSAIEGFDGRTIRAYPTVQDALDQMALLRSQVQGCDRDSEGDGLSDRLWRTFNSDTGYDSMTFGYTYEIKNGVGRPGRPALHRGPGRQRDPRDRVGRRVQRRVPGDAAPDQVELAQLIGNAMCVFSVEGC